MADDKQQKKDLASTLAGVNNILMQINPLIGISFSTARMLIELLRRQGGNVAAFEQEMAGYQASLDKLGVAIQEFKTRFPTEQTGPSTIGG